MWALGTHQGDTGFLPIDLSEVQPGEYMVVWSIYTAMNEGSLKASQILYLINGETYVQALPNFPGFKSLQLATILVEQKTITVDDEDIVVKRAVIQNQFLFDTKFIQFGVYKPWQTYPIINDENTSDIVKDLNLFKINKIAIYAGNIKVNSAHTTFNEPATPVSQPNILLINAVGSDEILDYNNYVYLYLLYRISEFSEGKEVEFLFHRSNAPILSEVKVINEEDGKKTCYDYILLSIYNLIWFFQIYNAGNIYTSKDYKNICLTNIDVFSTDEEALIDGYADILPNKLRGKEQSIEKPIINEKQPKTYVDFHITSGAQISEMGEKIITGYQSLFMYPQWRFDAIEGFSETDWLALNFNGKNAASDPNWTEYGKLRLNTNSVSDYFIQDIIVPGQHIAVQTKEDKLHIHAIDYVQSIMGDGFIGAEQVTSEETSGITYQLGLNLNIVGENGIEVTQNGTTFNVSYNGETPTAEGDGGYTGAYKILKTSENSVSIVDCSSETSQGVFSSAGKVVTRSEYGGIGQYIVTDLASFTVSTSADTYFFLVITYANNSYTTQIVTDAWIGGPSLTDGQASLFIGQTHVVDGKIKVCQNFHGLCYTLSDYEWC